MIEGRLANEHGIGNNARRSSNIYSSQGRIADPLHWFLPNLSVKLFALALATIAVVLPDLPQFQGKWMLARVVPTLFLVTLIPSLWSSRQERGQYPHALDMVLVMSITVDMSGNVFNLYDTVKGFDILAHCVGWAFFVGAFGLVVSRLGLTRLNVAALCIGFGSVTHILWEIGEYGIMKLGAFGLQLTYENTIHDFGASLLGTIVATLIVTTLRWPRKLECEGDKEPLMAACRQVRS